MGFFEKAGKFFGSGAAKAVTGTVQGLADVVNQFVETDDEKRAAKILLAKMAQRPAELQVELNKIGSVHRSIWVAGWRPAIGWVLALSLGFYYIPQFAMASVLWVKLCWSTAEIVPYPISDISGLMELVIGMLGLAGVRTIEKFGGISK